MIQRLTPHPDTPCPAVERLEVEVVRRAGGDLGLRYTLTGDTTALAIPAPAAPIRRDELWKHTCFEAFVRTSRSETYFEVNLAPSAEWAAYAFDGYRDGMRPAELEPRIETEISPDRLELRADLGLAPIATAPWSLGLTAVIETLDGQRSYWALRHPPGKPDFHHGDGFALELPVPERP